ncbi:MAG TPA: hypothetical protein PLK12_04585 [Prolixibacteraceae bacterium]|nr:hypothetical protein [Prolixibacteraceae bacterium]
MKGIQLIGVIVFLHFFASCGNQMTIFEEELPEGSIVLKYKLQQKAADDFLLEILDIQDSRCPVGSVCDDAGNVQVHFRALTTEGIQERTLGFSEIPGRLQSVDTVMNRRIEIHKVTPIPYADRPVSALNCYEVVVLVNEI